jgi:hypothetical protein
MVRNTAKVHISTKMVINLSEIGLKIEKMGMEYLNIQMALFMMENG